MKNLLTLFTFLLFAPASDLLSQKRGPQISPKQRPPAVQKSREIGSTAVVIDETLSVLRAKPSFFAEPLQRMRRGRVVRIMGVAKADGVKFYRVSAPPAHTGWVQSDALFGKLRSDDDERLAKLVQAANGFEQIELAHSFFELFPESAFRAPLLLLYGDLLEEAAAKLSKDAAGRLDRREMAATGAPLHSYYLNFVMLDRYRKLGVIFLFHLASRAYHYDGASWKELNTKFPTSSEAAESRKRLESLKLKMESR